MLLVVRSLLDPSHQHGDEEGDEARDEQGDEEGDEEGSDEEGHEEACHEEEVSGWFHPNGSRREAGRPRAGSLELACASAVGRFGPGTTHHTCSQLGRLTKK